MTFYLCKECAEAHHLDIASGKSIGEFANGALYKRLQLAAAKQNKQKTA